MKNPLALMMLLALVALVACTVILTSGGGSPGKTVGDSDRPRFCHEGDTQFCTIGSCSGQSACINGVWSGCRWARVCTPGERIPCLKNGCAYAVKECDTCGTGFGECKGS
ncbi:MAG: hypothetical protein U0R44_07075 [Candidatus Micrarchaeia archaeon]